MEEQLLVSGPAPRILSAWGAGADNDWCILMFCPGRRPLGLRVLPSTTLRESVLDFVPADCIYRLGVVRRGAVSASPSPIDDSPARGTRPRA